MAARGSGVLAVAALERSLACGAHAMAEMLLQAVLANIPPDVLRAIMRAPEDVGAGMRWAQRRAPAFSAAARNSCGWPGSPRPR